MISSTTAAAFFDELTKIAKKQSADPETRMAEGRKMMGLGAAGAGAGMIGNAGAGAAMMDAAQREMAMEGGEEVFRNLEAASPVPVVRDPRGGMGAYASKPASKMMGLGDEAKIILPEGKSPAGVLGHEMGHAQFDKKFLGKATQNIPARIAFNLSTIGSPLAGAAAGYGIDDKATGMGVAAGIPLAIAAPTLLSEGVASVKGMGNLRRAGANPAQLAAARKTLLRAFGTYAGKAGMDTGLGLGGYGVGRYMRGASEAE